MSAELSFTELDGQHVELLPARTVLSALSILGDFTDDFFTVAVDDDGTGLDG
ncbi:MAG: hypothetical protein ACRDTF_21180 [Pseudonocardiaceae bacterium]